MGQNISCTKKKSSNYERQKKFCEQQAKAYNPKQKLQNNCDKKKKKDNLQLFISSQDLDQDQYMVNQTLCKTPELFKQMDNLEKIQNFSMEDENNDIKIIEKILKQRYQPELQNHFNSSILLQKRKQKIAEFVL
ncbi:hypothetical protein PPERSA_01213 [Pseudocohnilembus persalinus]|uniref:Uncharacterized protein n=1 Tax=Pseudocohnilembus persalinus TaxID=266149 RepID=A0A0V0R936_PSEPJ|nr:hypothetical protein PPERSA_01213 [Pseudocohnilembus persalinus]|eukprot:KRX11014.1 hypothetical protein PPERSA_01213 [Pseudocohnilembus persalinus]